MMPTLDRNPSESITYGYQINFFYYLFNHTIGYSANFFGINFAKPIEFNDCLLDLFFADQMLSPPSSIEQLRQRIDDIAGKTLGELAQRFEASIPQDLRIQKGWQGQFIERCLGADAGNESRPDFSLLDIELKTIPIDFAGKVQESTYVCVVNLHNNLAVQWRESAVFHKLKQVLWVPIAQQPGAPIHQSVIASPFLWQMNAQQEALIRQDWEDAMALISVGKVHQLNAKFGDVLQVRPKAANSRVLTQVVDDQGESGQTLPRGFYLRAKFTQGLLHHHLRV